MNKINWRELDELFIKAIQNLFKWPLGVDYYGNGCLFTEKDAYDSVDHNLSEYIGWTWDGECIKLYMHGGIKEICFYGPIYKESKKRIAEIEDILTKEYLNWSRPYMEQLEQRVIEAINSLYARNIPVEKIVLPRDWIVLLPNEKKYIGKCDKYLGISIEEGKQFNVFSPKCFGVYA